MARRVTTGRPPNGGSGCHIWWQGLPAEPLAELAATLEVLQAPGGPRISFWALQVSFAAEDGTLVAAAHTGLQYNPRFPGNRAVNWGGYLEPASELRELDGTESALPGVPGDPNTRQFAWEERRPYRFLVARGDRGWRSSVIDVITGETTVIRELAVDAAGLTGAVVWAELFAYCDDPASSARWSGFGGRTAAGEWVRPGSARVVIPEVGTGGCDNVDVVGDHGGGFVISTGTPRTAAASSVHQLSIST